MKQKTILSKSQIDELFLRYDRNDIKRTRNIRLVPFLKDRIGGKRSYGEWCHVIGIFQTLFYQNLNKKTSNRILDVGCGKGLLGISAEPFVGNNGEYIGIDVNKNFIDFCRTHYNFVNYRFIHHNVKNIVYAGDQPDSRKKWPLESNSLDLVAALSVWTHLNEEDAFFYLEEVARVLKPGKKAIITFFYLNKQYYKSLKIRKNEPGRYNMTNQNKWIFENKAYNCQNWFYLKDIPEKAIAIDEQGMMNLTEYSNLKIKKVYNGNWKESPGIFFQDLIIFQKIS